MPRTKLPAKSQQLALTLLISSLVSVALYIIRVAAGDSSRYWFLNWNLLLAWVPLILAWLLKERLKSTSWLTWRNLLLTALWLGFLPNSFYIISDFVHLHSTGEVSLLYDIVVFVSFAWNGFVLGFASLYLIHVQLLRKIRRRDAHILIGLILLLCGYAIYLGRYLRWNTWDVLINPAGLLFDVSDRLINPAGRPQMLATTAMFFVLLASMYAFIYRIIAIVFPHKLASGKPKRAVPLAR